MTRLTQRRALRIAAFLIFVFTAKEPEAFAQEASNRDKLLVFLGAGWAGVPSSAGFFGESTPREDHVAITGGAEFIPFAHVGFGFNVSHLERNTGFFSGPMFVQTTAGHTFVSGDAVFHVLVQRPISPFFQIGVARDYGPTAPVSGFDIAFGATIRMSRHVALRPELRSYAVHWFTSDPNILSIGLAYRW
jgi:hypothetical protein